MAPPTQLLNLDVEAVSGICGSISIACWVVVFSPQIVENFRRSSADGLSIQFIIVWLLGDVFNILGAVLQGVLPTMIILAIYYTIADIVLLGQCFYYRGFTWKDSVPDDDGQPEAESEPSHPPPKFNGGHHHNHNRRSSAANERTALLGGSGHDNNYDYEGAGDDETLANYNQRERRGSDWSHLSPAVPLITPSANELDEDLEEQQPTPRRQQRPPPTRLQAFAFNSSAILMVCAAGVAGWWLSRESSSSSHVSPPDNSPEPPPKDGSDGEPFVFNFWGQVFGWLCAALYLGSRLPQLLLNFKRKSTEGVSMLFFLFACLGNMTYVMSILAFDPDCSSSDKPSGAGNGKGECAPGEAAHIYWEYMLVNLSWLAGSAGTLLLDFAIFVQFFLYNRGDEEEEEEDADEDEGYESFDDQEEEVRRAGTAGSSSGQRRMEEQRERRERRRRRRRGTGVGGEGDDDDDGEEEVYVDQRPCLDRGLSDFGTR